MKTTKKPAVMRAYLGKDQDQAIKMLHKVHDWLGNVIRDGKCDDHCSECIGASDLADDIWDVLYPKGVQADEKRPTACPVMGKPCPMKNKGKVKPDDRSPMERKTTKVAAKKPVKAPAKKPVAKKGKCK